MTQDLVGVRQHWLRPAGLELMGLVAGSGLTHESYLVRRADGQVVQLTELLHTIVREASEPMSPEDLARKVSESFGRELDVDGLTLLAEKKLEPLGLLKHPEERSEIPAPTAAPLLALAAKTTIIPARASALISELLRPLYWPPLVVAACLALAALDVWLFLVSDPGVALTNVLMTPGMLLALVIILTAGALFHEMGHATACRYGGARPGVIGMGLYLVFPAFYTDVTDAYRLSRLGRIRTDLGGLYFHLWWVLAAGTGYLITGSPLLLLVVIMTQLQMVQQLPPVIRLDGYFVLADLAGVPDLFSRVAPVLKSLIPGRPQDPRVTELRPVARWIVTTWVLVIVPFLAVVLVWVAISLPYILTQAATATAAHVEALALAIAAGDPLDAVLAMIAITLIVLPAVGSVFVLANVAHAIARKVAMRVRSPRPDQPHEVPADKPKPRHAARSRRMPIGHHS